MADIKNIFYDGKTFFLIFLGFFHIFNVAMSKATVYKVEKVSPTLELGEGPHWDVKSQKLYFVDINAQKILRLDPTSGKITSAYLKDGPVGVAVPIEGAKDKFIAGCGRDVVVVTWDGESDVTDPPTEKLTSLDTDRNDTRINDGKCDPAGRFWVGTMGLEVNKVVEPERGALYVVGNETTAKQVLSPISISNGLAWNSQNNKMYYIDSLTRQVWAFDFDNATGSITNKTVIFDLEKNNVKGLPDGMTIDVDDNLWVALYNGGAVIQVDPKSGKLLRSVELPVDQVTSVAFGGAELDVLFVTTAHVNMTAEERHGKPESGSLYSITNLGVKGTLPTNFKSTMFKF